MRLILVNKPFQVLTRFTPDGGKRCLADVLSAPGAFPAGRLDYDSEGLVLLTDDGVLQAGITDPRHRLAKVYWVQVEGEPGEAALAALAAGPRLADGPARPALVRRLSPPPALWPRNPPIRVRAAIPTAWLELTIREGRNRQVRRMTAAVGHPTLRLVRWAIGPLTLDGLAPGAHRHASVEEAAALRAAIAPSGEAPRGARSASRPRVPARSSGGDPRSSGRPGRDRRR
jgi:23S rRNA pseudouridine2457 synthase